MNARRHLTGALAAAALTLTSLAVAAPSGAETGGAPAAESRSRVPDAGPSLADAPIVAPPAPAAAPTVAERRVGSERRAAAYGRPLFAFWGEKYNRIDGFTFNTAIRGSGTSVLLQAAWKTYRGVKPIKPKKVFVQARVDGARWSKVKGVKGSIGKQFVTVRMPAYVVPAGVVGQDVDYRFKTKKIKKGPRKARRSVTSDATRVHFDNPAMYTGDQARFYAPIANLCPNANITIDTNNITEDHDAVFDWQFGITIDTAALAAFPNEPEISKLGIPIHECAHMHQFYNWGGTAEGWKEMVARSAQVFVADNDPNGPTVPMQPGWEPLEHAADCAKELISSERYRTYGGYCNPSEYAAAGLLWQNQKY